MKLFLLFSMFCLLCLDLVAQKDSLKGYEVCISTNYISDFRGGGLGLYKRFGQKSHFCWNSGIEINLIHHYLSRFPISQNIGISEYNLYAGGLSLPISHRHFIGKRTRLFLEYGLFIDIFILLVENGTKQWCNPLTLNCYYEEFENLHSILSFNPGGQAGLGIVFGKKKINYTIRTDFKCGLRHIAPKWGVEDFYNRYFRLTLGIEI